MSYHQAIPSDIDEMGPQQRLVVECGTHVDENEDGYFWRKYGQKAVKGSSTPRQYYRCRNANCPVKKTVEASSKGNTIVTYDGAHCHEAGELPESVQTAPVALPTAPSHQYQATSSNAALPALRIVVKREHPSNAYEIYPTSVESPSSTFSTTDEEDSYLSEPSPKRYKSDEDATFDSTMHQYSADAPPSNSWLSVWDSHMPDYLDVANIQ